MFSFFLTLVFFLSVTHGARRDSSRGRRPMRGEFIAEIDIHVTHGTNQFNGAMIANTSKYVNWPLITSPNIYEVGAYNPDGAEEFLITADTHPNALVSTTKSFHDFLGLPLATPHFRNLPLCDVPTMNLFSTSVFDRVPIKEFWEANRRGDIYRQENAQCDITVGEWNRGSGKLKIMRSKKTGLYEMDLKMCGLRNSLYTIWETIVRYAGTPQEAGTGTSAPAGGFPNVIITDSYGYGELKWTQKWNPMECSIGADCTGDYSIVYHYEGGVYGGAPVLGGMGMAAGIVGSNHLWITTFGDILQEPHTKFVNEKCGYD